MGRLQWTLKCEPRSSSGGPDAPGTVTVTEMKIPQVWGRRGGGPTGKEGGWVLRSLAQGRELIIQSW